jgi:hypothetical protein
MLEGTELWVRLYRLLIVLIISWLIFEKSDLTTSYSEENFIFLFPKQFVLRTMKCLIKTAALLATS